MSGDYIPLYLIGIRDPYIVVVCYKAGKDGQYN